MRAGGTIAMAAEIFISYRRSRGADADRLEVILREAGYADYQIFRDVHALVTGESFESQLNDTLGRTEIVLFLLGPGDAPRDASDDWVTMELRTAIHLQKPVVMVVLDGAESEVRASWPADLESLKSPEFPRFSADGGEGGDQILQILRRRGVPPVRETVRKWNLLLEHNDVDQPVRELMDIVRHRTSGVVVVHGRPGTGRSHVLRSVVRELRAAGTGVGFHEPTHLAGDADGAVLYSWIEGVLTNGPRKDGAGRALTKMPDRVIEMDRLGMSTRQLPAGVRSLLDHDGRMKMIKDQRLGRHQEQHGIVAGAVDLLENLAGQSRLVLVVDDVDFADGTSQEMIRQLACGIADAGVPIILVVGAETGVESTTCVPDDIDRCRVAIDPDVAGMLRRGRIDERLVAKFVELELSPVQCVTYLKYLHGKSLLVEGPAGWSFIGDPSTALPKIDQVLDAELKAILPAASQQTLELGAIVGFRFRFALADAVASGGRADAKEALEQLRRYDVDQRVVRRPTEEGCDRITLSSSVWWRHLRARRALPDGSFDPKDLRSLAEALENFASGNDAGYEDWTSVAALYDRLANAEKAGSAYVRAAHIARQRLSPEAAARYYRAAAERFEEHVLSNLEAPLDRARTLIRAAYCWDRAATLESDASVRRGSSSIDRALAVLEQAREELDAHKPEHEDDVDLDDAITSGLTVQSEAGELVRLQWHTLMAYVELERGRRFLDAGEPATRAFTSALTRAETGLSGWACYRLIVVASAGLALALMSDPDFASESPEHSRGRARAALFHTARSTMVRRRHDARFTQVSRTEPQLEAHLRLAQRWVGEARRKIGERLGLASLERYADDERPRTDAEIVRLLNDLDTVMSEAPAERHSTSFTVCAEQLLVAAADLSDVDRDSTYLTDLRIAALSHDLFRSVDSARLLRLWRDLNEPHIDDLTWHNPILLHGPLAARFCLLDLGLEQLIGTPRFERICCALDSHTVGMPSTDIVPDDERFAQITHLADMRSRPRDLVSDEIWRTALESGGLSRAYGECFARQAERLQSEGNLVSDITHRVIKTCAASAGAPTGP
jgi:HD superfamily phosphohydrolase YqeK/tetratricopeptide (TPR) repeat protein